MIDKTSENPKISVLSYSLLFAGLYYLLVIGFEITFSVVGVLAWNSVAIIICAGLVSWQFARVHKRRFLRSEFWKLVIYCLFWSAILDELLLVLLGVERTVAPWLILHVYADLLIINLLLLLLGFGIAGKWINKRKLSL